MEKGGFLKVHFPLKLLEGKSTNPAVGSEALAVDRKQRSTGIGSVGLLSEDARSVQGAQPPEPGPALPSSAGQEARSTLSPASAESLVLTEGRTLTQGPRARPRSRTPVRTGSCVRWESPRTSSPSGKAKAWGLRSRRSTTALVASQPSSQPVGGRGLKTRARSGYSLALSLRKAQGLGRERG